MSFASVPPADVRRLRRTPKKRAHRIREAHPHSTRISLRESLVGYFHRSPDYSQHLKLPRIRPDYTCSADFTSPIKAWARDRAFAKNYFANAPDVLIARSPGRLPPPEGGGEKHLSDSDRTFPHTHACGPLVREYACTHACAFARDLLSAPLIGFPITRTLAPTAQISVTPGRIPM